jgi:hypothetical protein
VAEGVAFCSQCGAPQIRVVTLDATGEVVSNGAPVPISYVSSAPRARALHFPEAWWAAGLGVLAGAIPVIVLLGLPPGVGMIVAGFLSVLFYRRRTALPRFTVLLGARLGALCGLLASGALALGAAVAATVFHQGQRMRDGVLDVMQQSMARMASPPPPEVMELFKTPVGIFLLGVFFVLATVAFSVLGGLLGAAVLRKRDGS